MRPVAGRRSQQDATILFVFCHRLVFHLITQVGLQRRFCWSANVATAAAEIIFATEAFDSAGAASGRDQISASLWATLPVKARVIIIPALVNRELVNYARTFVYLIKVD